MVAELAPAGIVVTRSEGPDGPLTQLLEEKGARVLHWGSIDFTPPEDPLPFSEALRRLDRYHWVYFSSPRAVEAVVSRVRRVPEWVRVAAVGPSTAKALKEAGWPVHRVPDEASGEGMVRSFRETGDAKGARILFPASASAREVVREGLTALGALVDQVTAYRLTNLPLDAAACSAALERNEVQAVTFASPSAMLGLREGLGEGLFARLAQEIPAAAMGATTAGALMAVGWKRIEVADQATLEELAAAAMRGAKAGSDG